MNKDFKKGLNFALQIIKNQQRCSLCWEWMEDRDDGDYIDFEDTKNKLVEALRDDRTTAQL
jgi:hypothetical protein